VLKEQKVVTMMADAEPRRDPGLFTVMVRLRKPDETSAVRARIAAALAEAAERPIDSPRLAAIKSHLKYQFAGSLRTADAFADAVGAAVAVYGGPGSINELYEAYDRITAADLQRVASRYFKAANETAITLETESKK
jgi:zinc protease